MGAEETILFISGIVTGILMAIYYIIDRFYKNLDDIMGIIFKYFGIFTLWAAISYLIFLVSAKIYEIITGVKIL